MAYVAEKDIQEKEVKEEEIADRKAFILVNGWELAFPTLEDSIRLLQTFEARRIA